MKFINEKIYDKDNVVLRFILLKAYNFTPGFSLNMVRSLVRNFFAALIQKDNHPRNFLEKYAFFRLEI